MWPDQVKQLFLESGFSKELCVALILVEKPKKFRDYVAIIQQVAINLERGHSKGYQLTDTSPHNTRIDQETTLEVHVALFKVSRTCAKQVSKDVIKTCKENGLCLQCGDVDHQIQDYIYLPLIRLEGNHKAKVKALQVCQVTQVLEELSDFDNNNNN